MKKKLIKKDNKNCKAELLVVKSHWSDGTVSYQGKVNFYEKNLHLFSLLTGDGRLTKEDALIDAKLLAEDNGF